MLTAEEGNKGLHISTRNIRKSTQKWLDDQAIRNHTGKYIQLEVYAFRRDGYILPDIRPERYSESVPEELYSILTEAYLNGYDMLIVDHDAFAGNFPQYPRVEDAEEDNIQETPHKVLYRVLKKEYKQHRGHWTVD